MAIKNRLKVILAEKNMTQNELADKVELSKSALSNIINFKQNPTLETAFDIAEALNVTLDDIFYKEKSKEEDVLEGFKNLVQQMNGISFLYESDMVTRQAIREIYTQMKRNFQNKCEDPSLFDVCLDVCSNELQNLNPLALEVLYRD